MLDVISNRLTCSKAQVSITAFAASEIVHCDPCRCYGLVTHRATKPKFAAYNPSLVFNSSQWQWFNPLKCIWEFTLSSYSAKNAWKMPNWFWILSLYASSKHSEEVPDGFTLGLQQLFQPIFLHYLQNYHQVYSGYERDWYLTRCFLWSCGIYFSVYFHNDLDETIR